MHVWIFLLMLLAAVAQVVEWSSSDQGIGGLILGPCSQRVKVSLHKMLNPKLLSKV